MRKFFTFLMITGAAAITNAQVLLTDNFETYTIGNLVPQGGWAFDGGDINQTKVAQISSATHGKSMQLLRTTTTAMWVYKAIPWASRTAGNNILKVDFELYTGTGPGATSVQIYADATSYYMVGTIAYDQQTTTILYDNASLATEVTLISNATANTWYTGTIYYDATTGNSNVYLNGTAYGPYTGVAGKAPDEIDIFSGSGLHTMGYDNLNISAVNQILATTEVQTPKKTVLYPNPAFDFVYIQSSEKILSINVLDQSGRVTGKLKSTDKTDIQHLATGLYLIEIKYADGTVETRKLMKK